MLAILLFRLTLRGRFGVQDRDVSEGLGGGFVGTDGRLPGRWRVGNLLDDEGGGDAKSESGERARYLSTFGVDGIEAARHDKAQADGEQVGLEMGLIVLNPGENALCTGQLPHLCGLDQSGTERTP